MKPASRLILSTSPPAQTEGKPPGITALRYRKRLPCRGIRYRPTGKELDTETGLYYFGARYLDPKTARWISGDPAVGDYIPSAPVNDEAKKRNGSLPGMGGVFNIVNLHVYHYAGNNPVKYIDPDGRDLKGVIKGLWNTAQGIALVAGGIGTLAALGAAEAGSVGAATPVVILGGIAAFGLITNGLAKTGFGLAEVAIEFADIFTQQSVHLDTPTDIGGMIGAAVDVREGYDRSQNGAGPNEKLGSTINTVTVTVLGMATTPANIVASSSEIGEIMTAATTSVDTLFTIKAVTDYVDQK